MDHQRRNALIIFWCYWQTPKTLKHMYKVLNILLTEYHYWKKLEFSNYPEIGWNCIPKSIIRLLGRWPCSWGTHHSALLRLWLGRVSVGLSLGLPQVSVSPLTPVQGPPPRSSLTATLQLLSSCSWNYSQTEQDTETGATLPRLFI